MIASIQLRMWGSVSWASRLNVLLEPSACRAAWAAPARALTSATRAGSFSSAGSSVPASFQMLLNIACFIASEALLELFRIQS